MKAEEEGIEIHSFGEKISKELKVFYNPKMKLNRDFSLLILKTDFENRDKRLEISDNSTPHSPISKLIKYCDPMAASGIRQLRFIKTIPEIFDEITLGDISQDSINQIKNNFKKNNLPTEKLNLKHQNAINTITEKYYDVIELDPFGSPVPFLDSACQRIKHNGILSITATDTAALCGTYPKTTLRKYGISVQKTLWHEELGLRNLIAFSQRIAAQYEKVLHPIVSYTDKHYFRIFFKVEESRTKSYESVKNHKYLKHDIKTQKTQILDYEEKGAFGKTYIGELNNKEFLKLLLENIQLIQDNKEITKLLEKLIAEPNVVGYFNTHKLQKSYKIATEIKKDTILAELKNQGFEVSKAHNDKYGIKTNAPVEKVLEILK
ncbi:MAG: hypothetical protein ACOCXG_05110 [Nanoarchaeota archaeon]